MHKEYRTGNPGEVRKKEWSLREESAKESEKCQPSGCSLHMHTVSMDKKVLKVSFLTVDLSLGPGAAMLAEKLYSHVS
jgi:hypothetical protein